MLSNSTFVSGDRQLLEQKVFILQEELQEYKMKESKLSKLNESILQSYKLNQTIKENQQNETKRENRQLIIKHRQEIRKLKSQFTKDKAQLESQNITLKQKVKLLEDILEKTKLQNEQNFIDIRVKLENNHKRTLTDMQMKHNQQMKSANQQLTQKIQQLQGYIDQLEHQNQLYQEYIERKTNLQKQNDPKQINHINHGSHMLPKSVQNRNKSDQHPSTVNFCGIKLQSYPLQQNFTKQSCYVHQNSQQKYQIKTVPKQSKKLISELGIKINRAIKEINQNRYNQYY